MNFDPTPDSFSVKGVIQPKILSQIISFVTKTNCFCKGGGWKYDIKYNGQDRSVYNKYTGVT